MRLQLDTLNHFHTGLTLGLAPLNLLPFFSKAWAENPTFGHSHTLPVSSLQWTYTIFSPSEYNIILFHTFVPA